MAKKAKPKKKTAARGKQRSARRSKTRAARPSTTRSTAGPGFDFEDRVAAWLLLKALIGQPLPGIAGIAVRLQMQVEALGWYLDDILLTSEEGADTRCRLAISCKSNVQVTNTSLPADFVARCWQQWFGSDPNPMQRGRDGLALVTRGSNSAFMATWSELKNAAGDSDVVLALGRMRATAKQRAVFDSVKSPAADTGAAVTDADVVAMMRAITVIPVDFHIADSENEKQAMTDCRTLLLNGSLTEGKRLWGELVSHARTTRLGSGTLDLPDLWRRLRREFSLKDHRDFEASWRSLRALTADYKATIETALSTGVTLNRKEEIDELVSVVSQSSNA